MNPYQQDHQENNPLKKQQKERELKAINLIKQNFVNCEELLKLTEKYPSTFKAVKSAHPLQKNNTIVDLSLNARGPDEDQAYLNVVFLRNNVRRGNTMLINEKQNKVEMLRKGLIKFYDVGLNSLKGIIEENLKSLEEKQLKKHYIVFGEIENVLSCNEELEYADKAKVKIYRLNKANGENAQISYKKSFDQWVISSKNVSILLKNQNDIKHYKGDRYQFSTLIANSWFNILKQLTKVQVDDLKKQMQNKTLIGEYCGNPEYQHLVQYAQTTIHFYAITQINSQYSCIPPNVAFSFFEKHHLSIVKNYQNSFIGEFVEFKALGEKMLQILKQVETASIFDEGEGCVLYFVINQPKSYCEYISDRYLQQTVPIPQNWETKQEWEHVSSLGKLKTVQYRILRKLREKLKYFGRLKPKDETEETRRQDFNKFQQKYGSYEKQSYQLVKDYTLNRPIQYFFILGLFSMQYAFNHYKSSRAMALINDHFVDFVNVVFWCMQNRQPVTENLMKDKNLHERLRQETWQNYGNQIVNEYFPILERIVPRYAKIKKANQVVEEQEEQEQQEIQN